MRRWLVRLLVSSCAVLACTMVCGRASAFSWPGESIGIEQTLSGGDVARRREAADRLFDLGAPLATRLLLRALGDVDLEVRLRAAHAATRLRSAEAAEAVIPWLAEPEPELRLSACRLIESAPTQKGVLALGRVLGDADANVRARAAAAMGASGFAEATGPLLGHLDDSSPVVRAEIAEALARVGDASAVVPLIGKVSDGTVEVRQAAVRALGELGDARATGALVLALRDNAESVRIDTLDALGRVGGEQAAPAIAPLLETRSRPEVRKAALRALGSIGSDTAIRILVEALATDDVMSVDSDLRDALVATGSRSVAPLLATLRARASETSASAAALALGALGAREARRDLIDAMQKKTIASGVALRALSLLGDAESVPSLLPLIQDRDALIRSQALDAVAALLDPATHDGLAVDPLATDLLDPQFSSSEKEKIARALGRTGSGRALASLVPMVATGQLGLKLSVIDALGMIGPAGQDSVLLDALDDERGIVRLNAAQSLARSAGPRSIEPLFARLADSAEQDRGAVGLALSGALSRATDPGLLTRAVDVLGRVREEARDAVIEGLGRMPIALAGKSLVDYARIARGSGDRRKIAEALAGHPSQVATLLSLTEDADAPTRAEAAWSLGRATFTSNIEDALERLALRDRSPDVASNAVAALTLLVARSPDEGVRDRTRTWLCDRVSDSRAYVRVNALSGLLLLRARCAAKDAAVGSVERVALARDSIELVRWAAARLVATVSTGGGDRVDRDDTRALLRCAADDRSGRVAAACMRPRLTGSPREASSSTGGPPAQITVFVVSDGRESPVPSAAYSLLRADGLIRSGNADRRGAVFELAAPEGGMSLVVPAALCF